MRPKVADPLIPGFPTIELTHVVVRIDHLWRNVSGPQIGPRLPWGRDGPGTRNLSRRRRYGQALRERRLLLSSYLRERAEMAKFSGDRDSAITWWDIALAAIEILSARGASLHESQGSGGH